jgi:tetratricopeptide (TPR) repeat protein
MRLSRSFLRFAVSLVILLLLLGLAYRQAPENVFHLDDFNNIVGNSAIHVESLTAESLRNAMKYAVLPARPLANLSFAFDWWRGGGDPRPFQWTNLTLHAVTSFGVFVFLIIALRRAGYRDFTLVAAGLLGAGAWACHPIQVQAVTYIVQRMATMATLFTLLTVILYVLGRQSRSRGVVFFILAGLSFLLGVAAKENAAIAAGLVLLAEYGIVRHGQAMIRRKADWLFLALPAVVLVYVILDFATQAGPLAQRFLPGYAERDFTLAERLWTQPRVIAFHFSQILWPLPDRFSLEHDFTVSTGLFSPPSSALAVAGVVLWCGAGLWAMFRRRWRLVGFFLLWVPATLAIESTFIALEMVFEHRMYMASIGLAGLMALGMAAMLDRVAVARVPVGVSCLAVVVLLALATSARMPVWSDRLTVAESALQHAPNSARAYANFGMALFVESRWDEAEAAMRQALELDPDEAVALAILAVSLTRKGELAEADRLLARRLKLGNIDDIVLNALGDVRLRQGKTTEAIHYYRRAIAVDAARSALRWNLAVALERAGNCRSAREQWLKFLELETQEALIHRVRGHLRTTYEKKAGACFGTVR